MSNVSWSTELSVLLHRLGAILYGISLLLCSLPCDPVQGIKLATKLTGASRQHSNRDRTGPAYMNGSSYLVFSSFRL